MISFYLVRKTSDALAGNQTVLQVAILAKERIKNVHCEFRSFKNYDFMDKLVMSSGNVKSSDYIIKLIISSLHREQ